MSNIAQIHALIPTDSPWLTDFLREQWASTIVISRGKAHDATTLPGFIATIDGDPVGLAHYHIENGACELVTLASSVEGRGVGSALIRAVREAADAAGCHRLWCITTNDNTPALRFYQKRGFRLVAVHVGAVDEARRTLKPEIPELGFDGIPIHDEIELEIVPEQSLSLKRLMT